MICATYKVQSNTGWVEFTNTFDSPEKLRIFIQLMNDAGSPVVVTGAWQFEAVAGVDLSDVKEKG